jgi:hypothetical protein
VVAHHHPSPSRDHGRRRATEIRNDLWTTWRRRPLSTVLRSTFTTMRLALRDPAGRAGIREAIRGLSWVVRDRRVVPPHLERRLRLLSAS